MNEIPPVTKPASRKASGESALSYSKFNVNKEVRIVADPAKVTGLKPPKDDDSQLEPPPQPIPEVQIVDGPKPDPVANEEQPLIDAYLEQQIGDANLENPVPEVQQQNEGAQENVAPENQEGRTQSDQDDEQIGGDQKSSSSYEIEWKENQVPVFESEPR